MSATLARHVRGLAPLLAAVALTTVLFPACASGDDAQIALTVDDLVDAMNDGDTAAVRALHVGGAIAPTNGAGDSSVIYRLVTIPGGDDFDAANVASTVLGERAQATFDLAGSVVRGNEQVGEMTMRVGVELEKVGDEWLIIPGSDRLLSTY